MMIVALLIGIALPAVTGWNALLLMEGRTRFLLPVERAGMGCILGTTLCMFAVFAANVFLGIPLALTGFAGTIAAVAGVSVVAAWMTRGKTTHIALPSSPPWSGRMTVLLYAYTGWVALRIAVFLGILVSTPAYFDDTLDNWNMRGKLFYYAQKIVLHMPWETDTGGIHSYPPTVPLMKTWLSVLNGGWSEGLSNVVHAFWFFALLGLVYGTLRRRLAWQWAMLGTTVLASLPVEMIQGMNAYADVFLSAHVYAAAAMLAWALTSRDGRETLAALRVALLALALLPFVKNEGWALYLPMGLFLSAVTAWILVQRERRLLKPLLLSVAIGMLMLGVVAALWIGFKVSHGLSFGNAKGIDTHLEWQPGVLQAILVNTFLEGNWNLLPALCLGSIVLSWKRLWRSPELLILLFFFALPYAAQTGAFLFTGLGAEALFQTGTARGLIHLMPIVVTLTMLLLCKPCLPTQHSSDTSLISR